MTDIPFGTTSVVTRLGVTARTVDDELVLSLEPSPEILRHGVIRASVLAFVVDVVAGIAVDKDPDLWTLTSDMTVRMRPRPAVGRVEAVNTTLRQGRRSMTSVVELIAEDRSAVAIGAIGSAKIARRPGDPPKPTGSPDQRSSIFGGTERLGRPFRDACGIEVIDAEEGIVEVVVTPELRNPVGTLQGALVALLAEAAAEELVSSRFSVPAVVTDLDLRYLAQAQNGPVRTSCRLLGSGPGDPVEVRLTDTSAGRLTTLVYARAVPAPSP